MRDAREFQPGLERGDRAGGVRRAAADLDLAPAGLAPQRQEHAVVEEFRPARPLEPILGRAVEADDLRAAQAAGEAEEEDRPVAQVPESSTGAGRSSMARTCSGRSASFWTGGRPWVRRTPASTVATWRSLRSKGRALWAKFQTSAESRRSIVATVRLRRRACAGGERREIEADASAGRRAAAGRGPGGRASANSRASRRRRRGWCLSTSPRGRRRGRSRPAARGARAGEAADRRPVAALTSPQAARRGSGACFRPLAGSNRARFTIKGATSDNATLSDIECCRQMGRLHR